MVSYGLQTNVSIENITKLFFASYFEQKEKIKNFRILYQNKRESLDQNNRLSNYNPFK